MSDPSTAFIIDRASKSTAIAITFTAQWIWDEKTPAQHDAMRTVVEFTEAAGETLKATMLQARSNLDDALDQYHRWTVQGLSLARVRTRNDAGKSASLSTLSAQGGSRAAVREEGLRWLAWWVKFDSGWTPLPGLTIATFTTLKQQIEGTDTPGFTTTGLADVYDTSHGAWRAKVEEANALARTLEDVNEAWYAAATAVFPAGTPQGELIRGQVPTTYTPGNAPAALEIGSLHQDNATAVTVNYTPGGGTGATALTLQYKLPGEAAFGHDAPVVEPSQQVVAAAFAGALVIFRTRATVSGGETLGAEKSIQM